MAWNDDIYDFEEEYAVWRGCATDEDIWELEQEELTCKTYEKLTSK